jgi:hypothetical protein
MSVYTPTPSDHQKLNLLEERDANLNLALLQRQLNALLGKSISQICPYHYVLGNQCAHFVSHVLGIQFGALCSIRQNGTSLRCDEIYNSLVVRGPWTQAPPGLAPRNQILIFVITAHEVLAGNLMTNWPRKHVGIQLNGRVYNYSNTGGRVIVDASVSHFLSKFVKEYSRDTDVSLYYGGV